MGKSKKQDTPKEQKSDAESSSSLDEAPTKKVEKQPATPAKWLPKQVFVSGLPYETTEEVLRAFFGEIASEIGSIKLPKYQDSSRCIGYAHVMFNSKKAYDQALEMDRKMMGSRYLDIKPSEGTKILNATDAKEAAQSMPADCVTLFVKGLPYTFKEDDVGDRFRRFGEIKAIRLAYNWQTKQSKGFAYIQFETHESAKTALLKMNGMMIDGRQIKVDFDVKGTQKASYHINTNEDKNRLYNRDPIKMAKSKAIKKEREKKKMSSMRH